MANNLTLQLGQAWQNNTWVDATRFLFYYQLVNSTATHYLQGIPFRMYPNPSTGIITVDVADLNLANGTLNVFNTQGQLLYSADIQAGNLQKTFDFSSLPNGNYYLQLRLGNKQSRQAFLIAH